jgi:hypothetical protein
MFVRVLSHTKQAPPVGEGICAAPEPELAQEEQMLTSEQLRQLGTLQVRQVFEPVSVNPEAHVVQTLACWHSWQFATLQATQLLGALRVNPLLQVKHVLALVHN